MAHNSYGLGAIPFFMRKGMRWMAGVLGAALILAPGCVGVQAQSDNSAKQDMKNAGHDTKQGAKDAGNGVKKGTKSAYHSTKKGTEKAYHKTKSTTKGAVQGGKEGAKEPQS
jgi:hypothetical protein